jgi:ABC-type glycerol-3-phosphate transport system substrate-binding protein
MLFYNADLLKEYGVEVPKTLEELKVLHELALHLSSRLCHHPYMVLSPLTFHLVQHSITSLGKDAEPIREVLLDGAKIDGKQYGIPFNKSTEMLF